MVEQALSRKLAVILHADVVGSSALVQRHETLAHQRINETFQRFSSIIQAYGGSAQEIRGDALVAEFSRPSDAVCAALKFQQINTEHNARLEDGIAPEVRVGIALGEEVVADHTVTGSGVVLAQRVEQMSEPGGVYVTSAIHEAIPRRLPFNQESLGERKAKGFEEPIRVYRVELKEGEAVPEAEAGLLTDSRSELRRLTAVVAAVVLLGLGGATFWLKPWAPEEELASVARMAFPLPDKPSIAVLPFDNIGDDVEQSYFADGMTDDLITDLSKISGLFVIARNSSFAYRGKTAGIRQVAEDLGVRYLLKGSVRRSGARVRINAQLIDATTRGHVWADRFDGDIDHVFQLQDEVTRKIVAVMAVQLTASERAQVSSRGTDDAQAYDAFLRGWEHYLRQTPDDFARATSHFNKAIDLDPGYSRAYAALAATYWESWKRLWHETLGLVRWHDARSIAEKFLAKAQTNPPPLVHQVAAEIHAQSGQLDAAIVEAERAISLDPNDADSYVALAGALSLAGRTDQALQSVERAMRLNPHYPAFYLYQLGLARFGMGQLEEAAAALEKATALNPDDRWSLRLLLATYGLLGRADDAKKTYDLIEESGKRRLRQHLDPLTIRSSTFWYPFKKREDRERFSEGLRRAGVPD